MIKIKKNLSIYIIGEVKSMMCQRHNYSLLSKFEKNHYLNTINLIFKKKYICQYILKSAINDSENLTPHLIFQIRLELLISIYM